MLRFHMIAGEEREGGSVEFSAPDVGQALAVAYQLADGRTFELWQETRRICAVHALAGIARIGEGGIPPFTPSLSLKSR